MRPLSWSLSLVQRMSFVETLGSEGCLDELGQLRRLTRESGT